MGSGLPGPGSASGTPPSEAEANAPKGRRRTSLHQASCQRPEPLVPPPNFAWRCRLLGRKQPHACVKNRNSSQIRVDCFPILVTILLLPLPNSERGRIGQLALLWTITKYWVRIFNSRVYRFKEIGFVLSTRMHSPAQGDWVCSFNLTSQLWPCRFNLSGFVFSSGDKTH